MDTQGFNQVQQRTMKTIKVATRCNETTKNRRILSTKRLAPRVSCDLGLMLFFLLLLQALQQPQIVEAELNGVEACQNRCFNQSECKNVGNGGFCCEWDDSAAQCVSIIGHDICPGTTTMPPSNACPPKAGTKILADHPYQISISEEAGAWSAPSISPTDYFDRPCKGNVETSLDYFLCQGFSIKQITSGIITLKISSGLSILGSSYIIQDVVRDPKKRNESTYHRIMLGLSCSDIILSFFTFFLGSWAMPKNEQLFAHGSIAICSVVGFFSGMAIPCTQLFNCSLAAFYLLKLKFSWVNSKVRAIEKWFFILPCTVGLLVGAASTTTTAIFGPFGYVCTPKSIVIEGVFAVVLLFSLCFVTISMFQTYRAVRCVEKGAAEFTFSRYKQGSNNKNTADISMSRRVMVQGVLYSAILLSQNIVFILSYVLPIPVLETSFTVNLMTAIIYPLQGFFNAFTYMIPLFRKMMMERKSRKSIQHKERNDTIKTTILGSWRVIWKGSMLPRLLKLAGKSNNEIDHVKSGQVQSEVEESKKEEEDFVGHTSKDIIGVKEVTNKISTVKNNVLVNTNNRKSSNVSMATSSMMQSYYPKEGEREKESFYSLSSHGLSYSLELNNKEEQLASEASNIEEDDVSSNNKFVNKVLKSSIEEGDDTSSSNDIEFFTTVDDYLKMMED